MEAEDRLSVQKTSTNGAQEMNEGWAVVCVIGVWGWILSGIGFILRAFPTKDSFDRRSAALWGGVFIFFYALWIAGMINT